MRAVALGLAGFIVVMVMAAEDAHAYIDPGSGSILLQLILGGVAGAAVVVKMYWQKFKAGAGSLKRLWR